MSQSDLAETMHDLRGQLSLRGAGAFRTLEAAFQINDRDGTTLFDFQEVEAILAKAGLFLKVRSEASEQRHRRAAALHASQGRPPSGGGNNCDGTGHCYSGKNHSTSEKKSSMSRIRA